MVGCGEGSGEGAAIIFIDSVPAAGSRTGIIYCRDSAPVYINRLAAPRTGGPADSRTGTVNKCVSRVEEM